MQIMYRSPAKHTHARCYNHHIITPLSPHTIDAQKMSPPPLLPFPLYQASPDDLTRPDESRNPVYTAYFYTDVSAAAAADDDAFRAIHRFG